MAAAGLLVKRPNESILYTMDFDALLDATETISTVASFTADTPSGSTALTIGSTAISGTQVQARISGGTNGYTYHVTVRITTSASNHREDCGALKVETC